MTVTTASMPLRRVVLYKHGVGYFEREAQVQGDETITLTFKQRDVSDVLKSLTVLDEDGGQVASISYDALKPLEQLLADAAISIPNADSRAGLLAQLQGARVALVLLADDLLADLTGMDVEDEFPEEYEEGNGDDFDEGRSSNGALTDEEEEELDWQVVKGLIVGLDRIESKSADGIVKRQVLTLLTDDGELRSFDLDRVVALRLLDEKVWRDLDYSLRTQLSAKKKESRTFTFHAQGTGKRTLRISYVLEAPTWKATYRLLLGANDQPSVIQGWAVVDNTLDEDWEDVDLSLVSGLPVAFTHDLYTPRYLRRPEVEVAETAGVLPPVVEEGMAFAKLLDEPLPAPPPAASPLVSKLGRVRQLRGAATLGAANVPSSVPVQIRERAVGDLFAYDVANPVTIQRNQAALVPIVLKEFKGRPVLLHNSATRRTNPMRCIEFENVTGLTLEGGPATIIENGAYVGEAMLETLKPNEKRLIPFAVELSVHVLDNVESHQEHVRRFTLRHGQAALRRAEVAQTTYSFNNKSDQEYVIYLDHPREGDEWRLLDSPDPVETTPNYWRFKFALPPRKVTRFVARQEVVHESAQSLDTLNAGHVRTWIEQKYLDKKTAAILQDLVARFQSLGDLEREKAQLAKEREGLHAEQARLRGNLDSLGDRSDEKELRSRYVRALQAQEDRLEAIHKSLAGMEERKSAIRREIEQIAARLDYEAEVAVET